MERWFDGVEWSDRWRPVEDQAATATADGVKVLAVIAIAITGLLVFFAATWVLGVMP